MHLSRLHEWPIVSVDVETTGISWLTEKIWGIAIATHDPKTGEWQNEFYDTRDTPTIFDALRSELPCCGLVVNHAIKFDLNHLANYNVYCNSASVECTMVRGAVINEHEKSFSLDSLCQKYIGEGKDEPYEELAKLFGGKPTRAAQILNLSRAPKSLARRYAIRDPELAIKLYLWQQKIIEIQKLEPIIQIEKETLPVLMQLERRGIRIDEEYVDKGIVKIGHEIDRAQKSLNSLAGTEINVNSSPQMINVMKPEERDGRWYIGDYGIPTTDTGRPSIDADVLRGLSDLGHPLARSVLMIRKLVKARSFLTNHIKEHLHNGRVHTNFNQLKNDRDLGTITGRLSCDDPALQQIPSRDDDMAAIVRAAFIPEDGHVWLSADWQQFEFRVFSHYINNERINATYRDNPGADFHQLVADLTGIPRKPRFAGDANAKQINLGMVFGMGKGKLAKEMGLPYTTKISVIGGEEREFLVAGEEAEAVFDKYHAAVPGVRSFLDLASSIAKSRGFVRTAGGRHIRFPGGQFTHKAGGLIFQGTSADCMKVKLVELSEIQERWGFGLLLPVHDEYDVSVPKSLAEEVKRVIKEKLESFGPDDRIQFRVPILSDVNVGKNWYEASK